MEKIIQYLSGDMTFHDFCPDLLLQMMNYMTKMTMIDDLHEDIKIVLNYITTDSGVNYSFSRTCQRFDAGRAISRLETNRKDALFLSFQKLERYSFLLPDVEENQMPYQPAYHLFAGSYFTILCMDLIILTMVGVIPTTKQRDLTPLFLAGKSM